MPAGPNRRRVHFCCKQLLLLIGFAFAASNSLAEETGYEEDHVLIGLEAVYDSGLYKGQDGFIYPDFYLDARYGNFFAQGQTVGYDMFMSEKASLSIGLARGFNFLDVSTISSEQEELFYGIEDRDRAIEVGLIYKYRSRVGLLSFEYFRDYSGAHEGLRTVTRLTRTIPNEIGIEIKPSLFVNYHSRKFNRYYYGVTKEENKAAVSIAYDGIVTDVTRDRYRKIRDKYQPKNSAHLGVDIHVRVPLNASLSVTGYLSYTDITGPVFRSPLIEDRKYYQSKIGLAYTF